MESMPILNMPELQRVVVMTEKEYEKWVNDTDTTRYVTRLESVMKRNEELAQLVNDLQADAVIWDRTVNELADELNEKKREYDLEVTAHEQTKELLEVFRLKNKEWIETVTNLNQLRKNHETRNEWLTDKVNEVNSLLADLILGINND